MTSSLAQLSAEFSVLLAAITHFTIAFFQHNKYSQRVTFSGQFLVWLGKCPLGSKLISGGVAIRMSWCAFFEKINSRGGRLFRIGEYLKASLTSTPNIRKHPCKPGRISAKLFNVSSSFLPYLVKTVSSLPKCSLYADLMSFLSPNIITGDTIRPGLVLVTGVSLCILKLLWRMSPMYKILVIERK